MTDYFSRIPAELLLCICEYAEAADVARLIRTCRSFTRLQQFLYRYAASLESDYEYLLECVELSNLNALTQLLAAGARGNLYAETIVMDRQYLESSLLHNAASSDNPAIVEVLLSYGVSPNEYDQEIQVPLFVAIIADNPAIVSLLLPITSEYFIPEAIRVAAEYETLECLNVLLAAGPDKSAISSALRFPIHPQILKALLQAGAVMEDAPDVYHPLLQAAKDNNSECVRILLEHGAEVDTLHQWGNRPAETPLLCAARQAVELDNTDAVRYMIEAGADVDWSLFLLQSWSVSEWVREYMRECLERVAWEVEQERKLMREGLVGD